MGKAKLVMRDLPLAVELHKHSFFGQDIEVCHIPPELLFNGWGGILPARLHHPPGFMGFAMQPHWQHGFTCVWQHAAGTGQRRFSADILSTLLAHAIFRGAENGRMIRTIRHTLPCPAIAGAAGGAA